jgi:hypothetical protein
MAKTWKPIAISPLTGMLDTRSRPADLAPGSFRYKLNAAINRSGSLCVRGGHAALNFGLRSDSPLAIPNWDFHRRDVPVRNPITFIFESTSPAGARTLFVGSDSELSRLNNDTSEWTQLSPGGTGKRWHAAASGEYIIFTNAGANGVQSGVLCHKLGQNGFNSPHAIIPRSAGNYIMVAKVAIEFAGVVLLMNLTEGPDKDHLQTVSSRIAWSDYNVPYDFENGKASSVAGFQDLDYGDDILAAAEMMGSVYIFTTRSIWRMVTNITQDTIFAFQKIYSEPKNQSRCLAYPNTLVTTGRELFWMGRDTIWTFNPYILGPESPEWLLKSSGALFSESNADRMDKRCCDAICGAFHPVANEVWFSYPQDQGRDVSTCINNRCLVLNTEFKTADYVDTGYSAFGNFRRTATSSEQCNADQVFIGGSASDYCLKSIGDVFYRETVNLTAGNASADIPDLLYATSKSGYFFRVMGEIPLGLPFDTKQVRELRLDATIAPNTLIENNLLTLRIGNSVTPEDPVANNGRCGVQWRQQEDLPLICSNDVTLETMAKLGENPSDPLAWTLFEYGLHLYFDVRLTGPNGIAAPTDHDVAFSAFRFDSLLV